MSLKALLTIHGVSRVLHDFNHSTEKADTAVVEQWEKDNEKAFTYTVLALDDAHRRKISKAKTVNDILAILKAEYQSQTTANKMFLKKQLMAFHMSEDETMSSLIAHFEALISSLEAIGSKVDNDDALLVLFNLLPPSYEPIIKPLEVMPNITLEVAKTALLNEEML